MDTSNALRIDANSRQWGGQHHGSDDRKKQRTSKLQALFAAIESGDLELAKQSLAALTAFDRPNYKTPIWPKLLLHCMMAICIQPSTSCESTKPNPSMRKV